MEKYIQAAMKLAITVAVGVLAFTASAQPRVIKHVPQSFIYGQNLVLSNNTTVSWNSTNVYTVVPYGLFFTNQPSSVTNVVNTNLFNPSWNQTAQAYPDYNGAINSNVNISIAIGSTNLVQLPNRLATTNLLANVIVPTSASTNTVTLTFERTTDGVNYGTTAADQFVVVLGGGGVTPKVVTTNLPAAFMTGTAKIRLNKIVADNAASSVGVVVNAITLGGFPP